MNALLSTAYFPNIQYISKFLIYKNILIEQFDHYSKQTYRNRCKILSANAIQTLTVPVKKNKYKFTKDVLIDYSEDWQSNHVRAIMSAYKNSAYYDYFSEEINAIILSDFKFLLDLNIKTLEFLLDVFDIDKQFGLSEYFAESGDFIDYRDIIHPKSQKQQPDPKFNPQTYTQVFSDRYSFIPNLSCLDLICNEGKLSRTVLEEGIL